MSQVTRPSLRSAKTHLSVEQLEDRAVPAVGGIIAAGAQIGGSPHVRLIDAETRADLGSFLAYNEAYRGGVRVATGDVNADGIVDIVTATGPDYAPHVKVFNGKDYSLLASFYAFDTSFRGGVQLTLANLDDDPELEVVCGTGPGTASVVKSFNISNGTATQIPGALGSFFPFDPAFKGGVVLAAGNVDDKPGDELIVGSGAGSSAHVEVIARSGEMLRSFLAYGEGFTGGMTVATGDLDGDGRDEIITGAGTGAAPHVKAFRLADLAVVRSFLAYDESFSGGVQVGVTDTNFDGRAEIITGPLTGSRLLRLFNAESLLPIVDFPVYSPDFTGGVALSGTVRTPVTYHGPELAKATYIDPTVTFNRSDRISLGSGVFVGPFVELNAAQGPITVGDGANLQDNVTVAFIGPGTRGEITIGDQAILAHGSSVFGPARVGKLNGGKPSFLGFNSVVDGATVEDDVYISILARINPGITIRSGTKVLPGKLITTQEEADNPALGKVTTVTAADRAFMKAVLHVNGELSRGYSELFIKQGLAAVKGIGVDPGDSDFNNVSNKPTPALTNGITDPTFRNRIVGDVTLGNTIAQLNQLLGNQVALRADEGTPFGFGTFASVGDHVTAHALEHSDIITGNNLRIGTHVVIHGGDDSGNTPTETTRLGNSVSLGDWSVVFRSTLGDGVKVGFRAYVDGSQLAPGTVVPDRAIIIDNEMVGSVEW